MAQSPEQELAEFLTPLPRWLQKILWYDYSSMTLQDWANFVDSTTPFTSEELQESANGWQPERYPRTSDELRPQFEEILQRCSPAEWKKYRNNAKAARDTNADSFVPMPHGKPGRKANDELAEQIFALREAGKTSREIQEILKASGRNISLEAVESYLKTRRRTPRQ